jgi:hypothetical protein
VAGHEHYQSQHLTQPISVFVFVITNQDSTSSGLCAFRYALQNRIARNQAFPLVMPVATQNVSLIA